MKGTMSKSDAGPLQKKTRNASLVPCVTQDGGIKGMLTTVKKSLKLHWKATILPVKHCFHQMKLNVK